MTLTFHPEDIGFSWRNAQACVLASEMAYDLPPTVYSAATDTQVLIRDCGDAIMVAVRGTKELRDFITDAQIWRDRLRGYPGGVQIHHGFHTATVSIITGVKKALDALDVPHICCGKGKPIFITGHSLGGAVAMEIAFSLPPEFNIHSIYTFGQPRIGNGVFARAYNQLHGAQTFRFVAEEDGIPRVPGPLIGYRHAGQLAFLNTFGSCWMNPSWHKMGLSDVWGIFRAWHKKPWLELLRDHALVQKYTDRINDLASRSTNLRDALALVTGGPA